MNRLLLTLALLVGACGLRDVNSPSQQMDSWQQMDSGTRRCAFRYVWGSSATDVFVTGFYAQGQQGIVLHYDGERWTESVAWSGRSVSGLWGSGPLDVYATTCKGTMLADRCDIRHYDGTGWKTVAESPYRTGAIWGSGPTDVFVVGTSTVGDNVIIHFDGKTWSSRPLPIFAAGIWGSSPSDVYAVGWEGVAHYNGQDWSAVSLGTGDRWRSVWGSSSADIYVARHQTSTIKGAVLHYDGMRWTAVVDDALDAGAGALWGSSPSNVFARTAADDGAILHYDGSRWVRQPLPRPGVGISSIWGDGLSTVFAVGWSGMSATQLPGASGEILRYVSQR